MMECEIINILKTLISDKYNTRYIISKINQIKNR